MTTSRLQERPVATRSGRIRVLAVGLLLMAVAVPVTAVGAAEPPIDAKPPAVMGPRTRLPFRRRRRGEPKSV